LSYSNKVKTISIDENTKVVGVPQNPSHEKFEIAEKVIQSKKPKTYLTA
jgi:hypothetical protein